MRCRTIVGGLGHALCALAAAGLMATSAESQGAATGSEIPCAVPMSWSIARIDPRFELSEERALQAARAAGELWEQAVDVELFHFGVDGGYPISFEYDARQATLEARRERERSLDEERREIEISRTEVEAASRRYDDTREEYEEEVAAYDRAVEAYNRDMARLRGEGEIPPAVREGLERRGAELERMSRELQDRRRELDRLADTVRDDVDRFNERIEELAGRESALAREFPSSATESGRYDERVTLQDGRPIAVARRIRVFQLASYSDLVLVLAHELGHALGLGHAPGGGAVMSTIILAGAETIPSGGVTPVDARMLATRCPALGGRSAP